MPSTPRRAPSRRLENVSRPCLSILASASSAMRCGFSGPWRFVRGNSVGVVQHRPTRRRNRLIHWSGTAPAHLMKLKGAVSMSLIGFLLVGLIAGLIARFLMPGAQPMGILATLALGLVGSFIGGFLSSLIGPHGSSVLELRPSGII